MPTITRSTGVRVTSPDDLIIPAERSGVRAASRAPGGRRPASVPMSTDPLLTDEAARMADALRGQDLIVVDTIQLPALPPSTATRRAVPQDIEVSVPLGSDEDAVILLEQNGMFAWQFDATRTETSPEAVAPQRMRRGIAGGGAAAVFRLRLAPAGTATPGGQRRGVLSDAIVGAAQAIVFKFAGRFLLGRATAFLERHVVPGVVVMQGADPLAWPSVPDFRAVALPQDRSSRVLLFVHGTFSSTKGGFGGLCATPWGQSFLEAGRSNYDAVVGFDHPTLSVDPRTNATELLRSLEARTWDHPAQIDIICHSRGAITVRSLTEHLLPSTSLPVTIERIVFVGGVNGGTLLAAPENWRTLIDFYTNLAVGATRAMSMFPSATFAAGLLRELMKSVGALVKSLVETGVSDNAIPGLAAMNPTGPFITELNQMQQGQPVPDDCEYYAITSDFEATLALGKMSDLPAQFLQLAIDGVIDRLMKTGNDLVVNTDSMTAIDAAAGNFVKDTLAFGPNGVVYHTIYFLQPQVTNALARWLDLAVPEAASPARRRGLAPAGGFVTPPPAASVDTDILVFASSESADTAAEMVERDTPSYVVIERPTPGIVYRYAFKAEEVLAARAKLNAALEDALNLHEDDSSKELRNGVMSPLRGAPSGRPSSLRVVVIEADQVVGVAELHIAPQTLEELAKLAAVSANPVSPEARIATRRSHPSLSQPYNVQTKSLPTMARPEESGPMPPEESAPLASPPPSLPPVPRAVRRGVESGAPAAMPPPPPPIPPAEPPTGATPDGVDWPKASEALCHFLAEMDDEVVVQQIASIEVTLSRELINAARAAFAATAVPVAVNRKLILDLVTKKNFENAGDSRIEVTVPAPGGPETVIFDVKATDLGDGEVWIRLRQGAQPLATLVLRCKIIAQRVRPPRRNPAKTEVDDVPDGPQPLNQLTIFENERGGRRVYQFIFDSPSLGWRLTYESNPIQGAREQYVANIYQDIESRWLSVNDDFDQFQIELKEFGAGLWNELFPSELQKVLWKERDKIDSIMVFSEEPFIPWEMVFLTEPGQTIAPEGRFLGEMGLVRWQHNIRWPVETLRARRGRCHYVIPKYPMKELKLAQAELEADFLETQFSAEAVVPKLGPVRDVLARPGAFDLLHFACHGDADSNDIARSELLLEGRAEAGNYIYERLLPSVVAYSAKFDGPGAVPPIVVLNACRAGKAGYKLTSIGGFAREFLQRGAGMFVAALWSVGDTPARQFTEELYTRLLAGDTLAEATIAARKKSRDAGEGTWLAYTVYGNPHARLQR